MQIFYAAATAWAADGSYLCPGYILSEDGKTRIPYGFGVFSAGGTFLNWYASEPAAKAHLVEIDRQNPPEDEASPSP